jgi:hypothetical protein
VRPGQAGKRTGAETLDGFAALAMTGGTRKQKPTALETTSRALETMLIENVPRKPRIAENHDREMRPNSDLPLRKHIF